MDIKFDFNDILLKPAMVSSIESRKEVDIKCLFNNRHKLPLMTAPMDTVVSLKNYELFNDLGYIVVLPRTITPNMIEEYFFNNSPIINIEKTIENQILNFYENNFISFGLNEMKELINLKYEKIPYKNILIDIANGHMEIIKNLIIDFKKTYPHITLMIGNIANPETYKYYAETQCVDYIRCGIGAGAGCLTTKSTSIGYPMASLINEIYKVKQDFIKNNPDKKAPYIVADGGMKEYADIIKAYALGSDVVMLGSLLNKSIESAGDNYWYGIKTPQKLAEWLFKHKFKIKKYFRGMSTKEAQLAMGRSKNKLNTSEGVVRYRNVEYFIKGWTNNLVDYLKSSMSYSDAKNLSEFIGKAEWIKITTNTYNRFNK